MSHPKESPSFAGVKSRQRARALRNKRKGSESGKPFKDSNSLHNFHGPRSGTPISGGR